MGLNPRFVLGDLDLTEYPFAVEFGSDLGNPETVVDVLASLLADGEIESSSRRSNRTLVIPVMIEGSDLAQLAEAEQALIVECDRQRNTLSVDPGDDYAPVTVFETFSAQAQRAYGDAEEIAGIRRWTLTIRALPYGRSLGKIVDDASTPPAEGGTVFNDCESTTGWASYGGSLAPSFSVDTSLFAEGAGSVKSRLTQWEPGSVYNLGNGTGGYYSPCGGASRDQVTGLSLSTGTGGYLSVAIRFDPENNLSALTKVWQSTTPGVWTEVPTWTTIRRDANGFVHYAWPIDGGQTILGLRFEASHRRSAQSTNVPTPYTWYDDFEVLPTATTDHQIVKQLAIKGSARTTGSLHIAAPTNIVALGKVLAITAPTAELPAGFQPDGARWVSQGTTTPDSTALGGAYYTPDTTTYSTATGKPIFDVPVGTLTAGPYTIVALVKAEASTLTFGVQAQLRVGSTNTGPTSAAEVSPTGLTTGWQFVTVGTVYLPPLPVQGADATTKVRLLFKGAKMANAYMIPAWQVGGRPVADFSIVDCGSGVPAAGGPSSHLWIDSPSTEQPQGGWWRGPASDRLNAQSAWPDAKKPGIHTFSPGDLTAFLVSTDAQGPSMSLEYFPAWYGSAAL